LYCEGEKTTGGMTFSAEIHQVRGYRRSAVEDLSLVGCVVLSPRNCLCCQVQRP